MKLKSDAAACRPRVSWSWTTRTGRTVSQPTLDAMCILCSLNACVCRENARAFPVARTYRTPTVGQHLPSFTNLQQMTFKALESQELSLAEADLTASPRSFHKVDPRTMVSFSSILAGRCRCPLSCASHIRFLSRSHPFAHRLLPIYVLPSS